VHSGTIFRNEAAGESFGDPLDFAGGGGVGCRRDAVLRDGSLPLELLDEEVGKYIAT
jgi:hypothetical protein